jgi:hypothetical protein
LRSQAIEIVRQRYIDFGPTLACEKLLELHDLRVSKETLPARAGAHEAGGASMLSSARPTALCAAPVGCNSGSPQLLVRHGTRAFSGVTSQ